MITLANGSIIDESELDFQAIRAQGSGGQNVNKVSSAIHLRFDINASSLPQEYKDKLLELNDQRINKDGFIVIKAQRFRTQEKNRDDALSRLKELIDAALVVQKKRLATKPTKASKTRRVDSKVKQGRLKQARGRIDLE